MLGRLLKLESRRTEELPEAPPPTGIDRGDSLLAGELDDVCCDCCPPLFSFINQAKRSRAAEKQQTSDSYKLLFLYYYVAQNGSHQTCCDCERLGVINVDRGQGPK